MSCKARAQTKMQNSFLINHRLVSIVTHYLVGAILNLVEHARKTAVRSMNASDIDISAHFCVS